MRCLRRENYNGGKINNRNSNIDMIRIVAMLLVVALHCMDYGGFIKLSEANRKRPIITRPEQVAAGSHLWDPAVRLFTYMLPVPYHLSAIENLPLHHLFFKMWATSRRLCSMRMFRAVWSPWADRFT